MRIKQFCKVCKQILSTDLLGRVQGVEFEDGFYCQKCAKHKVDISRRK